MAKYEVEITMDPETIRRLANGRLQLHGFKAVRTTQGGGAPLVWFRSEEYSTSTRVSWETSFEAYVSRQQITSSTVIDAQNKKPIDLGQTFVVTDKHALGQVKGGGRPGAISIHNKVKKDFTSGISQVQGDESRPLCAFPHLGGNLHVLTPVEKVFLMFSSLPLNTGTIIQQSITPGILIDLTGAPGNTRSVSYHYNNDWSWDGGVWGQRFDANANLVPVLIENDLASASELVSAA